jgi:hypothetical protein
MLLDPDPHSQHRNGSRTARSMQIRMHNTAQVIHFFLKVLKWDLSLSVWRPLLLLLGPGHVYLAAGGAFQGPHCLTAPSYTTDMLAIYAPMPPSCLLVEGDTWDRCLYTGMFMNWSVPLCTLQFPVWYGPVHNVFDACKSITRANGRGVGPWKSRLFWDLWNGIEPGFQGPNPLLLGQVMNLPAWEALCTGAAWLRQ